MGRTSKWLRSLFLSSKKPSPDSSSTPPARVKKKTKLALSKSADDRFKNEDYLVSPCVEGQLDANKHAIAVAAATAVVAEAALAAAQAAAEVVRLTSGSGSGRNDAAFVSGERRGVLAAVKIQSAFRAYLARRALRALKGLVKLQALVRGHIVRKQSADMLRRMQAMARIQARASAHRSYASEPSKANIKYYNSGHPGVANWRNYNQHSSNVKQGGSTLKQYNSRSHSSYHLSSNWLDHWMDQYAWNNRHGDDERSDKILEIDTWNPRQTRRNDRTTFNSQYLSAWPDKRHKPSKLTSLSRLSAKLQKPNPSVSSEEISSVISANFPPEGDQCAVWTAENSPRVHSASSRPTSNQRGPFTPTKSECSRSLFGNYFSHPNYMAYTKSSRAKVRSQSAPKQRMQLEELRLSRSLCEPDTVSEKGLALPGNYRGNTYLHSGQLRGQGTHASMVFSSTYDYRL